MKTLRAEAVRAFREGRAEDALALLTEVVRRGPTDHRARMFGAQCLAQLGDLEHALKVLQITAENLVRRDYLLSATLAARLGLDLRPGDPAMVAELRRVHARAAASVRRGAVPPPLPPDVPPARPVEELCALLRGEELRARAFDILATADEGAPASPGSRPPLPLFAFLDPDAFVELVPRMGLHEVDHGESIIREGEEGASVFVLVAGRARVERVVRGETRVLATLPGGSLFGEVALLTGGRRSATVVAEGECEVFEVSASELEQLSQRFPEVPRAIAEFAQRRVCANLLVTAGLFDNLPPERRAAVLERFRSRTVEPGERVVSEDLPVDGLYLVMSGELTVTKRDSMGETVSLGVLRDGDVFGEISLLSGGNASTTVIAARRSLVAGLPRQDFQALVAEAPAVGEYLRTLSEGRLRLIAESMRPAELLDAVELVVE